MHGWCLNGGTWLPRDQSLFSYLPKLAVVLVTRPTNKLAFQTPSHVCCWKIWRGKRNKEGNKITHNPTARRLSTSVLVHLLLAFLGFTHSIDIYKNHTVDTVLCCLFHVRRSLGACVPWFIMWVSVCQWLQFPLSSGCLIDVICPSETFIPIPLLHLPLKSPFPRCRPLQRGITGHLLCFWCWARLAHLSQLIPVPCSSGLGSWVTGDRTLRNSLDSGLRVYRESSAWTCLIHLLA